MQIITIEKDWKEAEAIVKQCGEKHAVLSMIGNLVARTSTLFVLLDSVARPISYNASYFGKGRKNIWRPYTNFYVAYTVREERRKGYAKQLAYHVRGKAIEAGCRRLKSLAGSRYGLALHASMGDQFWGLILEESTELIDVVVDTPLIDIPEYKRKDTPPPNAVKGIINPLSVDDVRQELGGRLLRYDELEKRNRAKKQAGDSFFS